MIQSNPKNLFTVIRFHFTNFFPMATNIDFDFIANLEGGTQSKAYVPVCTDKSVKNPKNKVCYLKPSGSVIANSGVTIGAGFDLGQQDEKGLKAMGISQMLIEK